MIVYITGVRGMNGNIVMRPWEGPRIAGRKGLATLLFFMQASLIFWPAAVRVAQHLERERQLQMLLDQLAAQHRLVVSITPASDDCTPLETVG